MISDLKPCPFCRSKDIKIYITPDFVYGRCMCCGARGPSRMPMEGVMGAYRVSKVNTDAENSWNTRTEGSNETSDKQKT